MNILDKSKNIKTGIVLSGGASKCIAHLGVLQALNELNIKIDYISAVSGGALLGSLYAAGLTPKEILKIIVTQANFSFYFPSFRSGGMFSFSRIKSLYKNVLPVSTFAELKIPLTIVATDVKEGKAIYFNQGNLLQPIIASSSYPIVFEPIKYRNMLLLDGGICNNFPIEPLLERKLQIIGSSVGKVYPIKKDFSVQRMMFRSLELAINENDLLKFNQCSVFIEPLNLNKFGMFDFSKGKKIFDIGYQHTVEMKNEIIKKIKQENKN